MFYGDYAEKAKGEVELKEIVYEVTVQFMCIILFMLIELYKKNSVKPKTITGIRRSSALDLHGKRGDHGCFLSSLKHDLISFRSHSSVHSKAC